MNVVEHEESVYCIYTYKVIYYSDVTLLHDKTTALLSRSLLQNTLKQKDSFRMVSSLRLMTILCTFFPIDCGFSIDSLADFIASARDAEAFFPRKQLRLRDDKRLTVRK